MKTQDKQILSLLQAFDQKMVLKAFDLYAKGVNNKFLNVEKELGNNGWRSIDSKPENREFYFLNGKYWVQSNALIEKHKKEVVTKDQKKRKNNKKKVDTDLKQVQIRCPSCNGKMYKQRVCPGCKEGKLGYRIRLLCENNSDHEILL